MSAGTIKTTTQNTSIPLVMQVNRGGGVGGLTVEAELYRADTNQVYDFLANTWVGATAPATRLIMPAGLVTGVYRATWDATALTSGTHPEKIQILVHISGSETQDTAGDVIIFTDLCDPLSRYMTPIGQAIVFDGFFGNNPTTPQLGVDGTMANPVNNEADLDALLTASGLRQVWIQDGTLTLASGGLSRYIDFVFAGPGNYAGVAFNGKRASGVRCHNLNVSGSIDTSDPAENFGSDLDLIECNVFSCFQVSGRFTRCSIGNDIVMATAAPAGGGTPTLILENCRGSSVSPSLAPSISCGLTQQTVLGINGYTGQLRLGSLQNASTEVFIFANGMDLEFVNASNTVQPASLVVAGDLRFVDNSAVGFTVDTKPSPIFEMWQLRGLDENQFVNTLRPVGATPGHIQSPPTSPTIDIAINPTGATIAQYERQ